MKDIAIDLSHLLGFKLTDTVRAAQTDAKMGLKPVDPVIGVKVGAKLGAKVGAKPVDGSVK